jgi:hypothetical protein
MTREKGAEGRSDNTALPVIPAARRMAGTPGARPILCARGAKPRASYYLDSVVAALRRRNGVTLTSSICHLYLVLFPKIMSRDLFSFLKIFYLTRFLGKARKSCMFFLFHVK